MLLQAALRGSDALLRQMLVANGRRIVKMVPCPTSLSPITVPE